MSLLHALYICVASVVPNADTLTCGRGTWMFMSIHQCSLQLSSVERFHRKSGRRRKLWKGGTLSPTCAQESFDCYQNDGQSAGWGKDQMDLVDSFPIEEECWWTITHLCTAHPWWLAISPPRRQTPGSIPTSTEMIRDIYGAIW